MAGLSHTGQDDLAALLAELSRQGVRLALNEDGQIALNGPRGGLTAALLQRVRAHKAALAEGLRRGAATPETAPLPTIEPDPAAWHEPFPLSDLQTAFAMGDSEQMEFHVRPHCYVETDRPGLDPQRYERALNAALRRQRANLPVLGDDMQLRCPPVFRPVSLPVHDLRGLPPDEQQHMLLATRAEMSRRTLPLDRWPWFECALSLHGDGQVRLHWNHNNFFGDGYGTARLLADAERLYHEPAAALPELRISYRDCVLALQRLEASASGARSWHYWTQRLPALPGPPPIPVRSGFDPRQRSRLERRDTLLPAARWSRFKALAQQHGLTPSNALFAVHAEVLARWSGSRHFLLNNMVTHRLPLHSQVSEVFGNFASLYPLEVDWRDPAPFAARACRLQQQIVRDLQHTHCSGVRVLQALNQAQRTPGRAPCPFVVGSGLFMPTAARPGFTCLETPQVMLDHQFWELQDGRLWAVWDVIEACFPPGLVDAMWQAYQALLATLADDAAAWQQARHELLPAEQRQRREQANRSDAPRPSGLLHEGLARSARRWPDKPALIDARRTMSYAQLHCHANRLAHALLDAGVQPGERIAVLLDKGWEQAVAVYGALRAGAAYVPIDPAWPRQRITRLLASTEARHLVTRQAIAARFETPAGVRAWCVDDSALGRQPGTTPPERQRPDDLAYLLFTSGSTGEPKGVMVEHRAALNTVADINRRFGIGEHDVVFGLSSLCFDLSVYDLFGTLAAGATLLLPPAGEVPDPGAWLAAVRTHGATVWNSVPALMQLLLDAAEAGGGSLPALRTVMLSGDWIALGLPERIAQCAPAARVISLGGATEASIWSIHWPVERVAPDWASIPYGLPLANQRWHVLHDDGHDAPDGVPGHLHIAGDGLARGYWRDEARTAAAFVPHPRSGERLYRTGDIGRYLPDGSIELLGRSDFQLKVQGLRVEPGEIEQALRAHADVQEAVVLAVDSAPARGAGRRLVAFVVMAPGAAPPGSALQDHLRQCLPAYMQPSALIPLDRLPLTATGKLDRQALQRHGEAASAQHAATVPPRTALEAQIAATWQAVLGLPRVGVDEDFFALGGQSFAALRVVTQLSQQLGQPVPLSALLEGRTVAGLAGRIARAAPWSPLVDLQRGGPGTPWVLVHPAGGGVLCYQDLAATLARAGGGPVYGLQAPGLAGEQPALDSIEAFATLYLGALRRRQPHGPYRLGGWSSGGVIAFEMARQLEQQGETVQPVLMLDTPAPMQHGTVPPDVLQQWFAAEMGAAHGGAALQAGAWQAVQAVFRGVVEATRRYRPGPPPLQAGILLLRASEGQVAEFDGHPETAAPDWGWRHFTRGRVRSIRVPGTHRSIAVDAPIACLHDLPASGQPATEPPDAVLR